MIESNLEPLDRVVNLYQTFRADGQTTEDSWLWACRLGQALEQERELERFRLDVESDLHSLKVKTS